MLISMLSLKGSPGVTTFAVALAARWPDPARPVVVEADPAGGDLGPRFSLAASPGLVSLAAAARSGTQPDLARDHTQQLPGGLAVVPAPPDAEQTHAALAALLTDPGRGARMLRSLADVEGALVIVDCGRVAPDSPVLPVLQVADAVLLLTRAHADDLAHLPRRLPQIGRWSPNPILLLAGEGHSTAEVAREFGVAPLGRIPHDPAGAAVLCGRSSRLRWGRQGPDRSALGRFAARTADVLAAREPSLAPVAALLGNGQTP